MSKHRKKRRAFEIRGAVVPRGSLEPNNNHPYKDIDAGSREAFINELAAGLSELPGKPAKEEGR